MSSHLWVFIWMTGVICLVGYTCYRISLRRSNKRWDKIEEVIGRLKHDPTICGRCGAKLNTETRHCPKCGYYNEKPLSVFPE